MSNVGRRLRAVERARLTRFPRKSATRTGTSLIDTNRWKWSALRKSILARDGWRCGYCGAANATTVDHKLPRSRGGDDSPENLVACCPHCQSADARPQIMPFTAPPAATGAEAAIVAKVRPIFGELTLGKPRADLAT